MKRKIKNNFFLLFCAYLFFSNSALAVSFNKKNTLLIKNNNQIPVSKEVFARMENYLKGSFFSKNLNRKLIQVSGIYMSISEKGDHSSISFCDADNFDLCAEQHLAFQTLKKCEKISEQKCYLVFRGKTFLPRKDNKLNLKKYFYIQNNKAGEHVDIQGKTLEEFNIPDD